MAVWPSQLPPPRQGSLSETLPENTIRSNMDYGPAKTRRRTTANVTPLAFTLRVPVALRAVLLDFFFDEVSSGALAFSYNHPVTGVACEARFAEPPGVSHVEADVYDIAVKLEILP